MGPDQRALVNPDAEGIWVTARAGLAWRLRAKQSQTRIPSEFGFISALRDKYTIAMPQHGGSVVCPA